MTARRVLIGRIVKPHGIRGEVAVDVLSDVAGRFDAGTSVDVDGRLRRIDTVRPHQGRLLIRFDGVPDRTAAEGLRGGRIEADAADVSDHDHWFVHELIGMDVVGEHGEALGTVTNWIELPDAAAYDLLEVDDGGRTWLLPAVEDYVVVDDTRDPHVLRLVDPPEGLVDPAAAEQ
ncbi:MAG: ribosome maturation factor RimM [Nitriliruptoraceae bacterium]